MSKIRVGIFFGGPSREREISFAGGRTVYDNLDKSLFEAIPIFVTASMRYIVLDWEYIYKGTIRDFYPPLELVPKQGNSFQIYEESLDKKVTNADTIMERVGTPISIEEASDIMDIAFLGLHGFYGEDGQIQAILESHQIPYTGSGIFACATGMDKSLQKKLMDAGGFETPEMLTISRASYLDQRDDLYHRAKNVIGFPLVIRPANQGSSIGVSILKEDNQESFNTAIDKAFFVKTVKKTEWLALNLSSKVDYIQEIADLRNGVGFPLQIVDKEIHHPDQLLQFLDQYFDNSTIETITLYGKYTDAKAIVESFIDGREFSCIVIKDLEGRAIALPPTEIIKKQALYDYRSKYLPGLSRKVTPIDLANEDIEKIRQECERLFDFLAFDVYARIDGFITKDKTVILNDPNTTSGMLPSSFFFHQAAEIGLNPSEFISYIIYRSLQDRIEASLVTNSYPDLLKRIIGALAQQQSEDQKKIKVAVIFGGYSFERHISVESGRNIYEKLASSEKYEPIPIFLHGSSKGYKLYRIPINLLLKDNADDIKAKIDHFKVHPITRAIRRQTVQISEKFIAGKIVDTPEEISLNQLSETVDKVFIALHGRPGEDGQLQRDLSKVGLAYNGSDSDTSSVTINKYQTLQTLKAHGFKVTDQYVLDKSLWSKSTNDAIKKVEALFEYPFIAKPVDDGCSSAVMLIKSSQQLHDYLACLFRDQEQISASLVDSLNLTPDEEFPIKSTALIEQKIERNGAKYFLEITGGFLTQRSPSGISYEIFEPSEALSTGEVLTLEEKFLAGEGQNITPARFGHSQEEYLKIASQVKKDLEKAARILKVEGYARIDAFVRVSEELDVETIIIEVNSLPGMTPATCIFHQAAINGYKPYGFIDKILEFACHED